MGAEPHTTLRLWAMAGRRRDVGPNGGGGAAVGNHEMTASGVYFARRIMQLARRCAPLPLCRRRRKLPDRETPVGPKLVVGRGRRRRRVRPTTFREYCRIVVWTVVIVGLWMLWNRIVWGWW